MNKEITKHLADDIAKDIFNFNNDPNRLYFLKGLFPAEFWMAERLQKTIHEGQVDYRQRKHSVEVMLEYAKEKIEENDPKIQKNWEEFINSFSCRELKIIMANLLEADHQQWLRNP